MVSIPLVYPHPDPSPMRVINRKGEYEEMDFNAILERVHRVAKHIDSDAIDSALVTQKVVQQMSDEIQTRDLDRLASEVAIGMATNHPDYGTLAAHLVASSVHKDVHISFLEITEALAAKGLLSESYLDTVRRNAPVLETLLDYHRDFLLDYFGYKTLLRGYLMRVSEHVHERPQDMFLRVAIQLHGDDLARVQESYEAFSRLICTHATPTLFHSGTKRCQMGSCFLGATEDSVVGMYETVKQTALISQHAGGIGLHVNNIRSHGAYIRGTGGTSSGLIPFLRVLNQTARHIDQGGKRRGSFAIYLSPTHPEFMDFCDLRKNFGNEELRCRDLFLAAWIPDLFMERVEQDAEWSFFDPDECPRLDTTYGDEFRALYESYEAQGRAKSTIRARDVWNRMITNQMETGTPYVLYKDHINHKSNQKHYGVIRSSNLCVAGETEILTSDGPVRIDTLVDQDVDVWNGEQWSTVTVRRTHDHAKLVRVCLSDGRSLTCTEYHVFYLDGSDEPLDAVELVPGDVLCGWTMPSGEHIPPTRVVAIEDKDRYDPTYCFNEPLAHKGVFDGILTGNCSEIVEYSDKDETAVCNLGSINVSKFVRPDGTYDFDSLGSITRMMVRNLDRVIDLNYYPTPQTKTSNMRHRPIGLGVQGLADAYAMMNMAFDSAEAMERNKEIFACIYYNGLSESVELAKIHGSYTTFKGSPFSEGKLQCDLWGVEPVGMYDWDGLRSALKQHGARNSLITALMPTASTSNILGSNECFEPFTSNVYTRRTLAGEFVMINKHLTRALIKRGLWTPQIRTDLIRNRGSVQSIAGIPDDLKSIFKTVWEIKQRVLLDQAADRAPYIDQSQSMNLFIARPNPHVVSSALFYGWKRGLKTGLYYLRSLPVADAVQITTRHADAQSCESCSA